MIESLEDQDEKLFPWVRVGALLTLVWGFAVWCLMHNAKTSFFALELNEQGDFIAGASSALAFMWLVIATMLQRQELQLQRKVSKQQTIEMNQQSMIFEKQVELLSSQTQIQHESLQIERNIRQINLKDRHYSWAESFINKEISKITVQSMNVVDGKLNINYISDQKDRSEHVVCGVDDNGYVHSSNGIESSSYNFLAVLDCASPATIFFVLKSRFGIYVFGFRYATEACPCLLDASHLISPIDLPGDVRNAAGFYTLKPIRSEYNDFGEH